MVVWPELLKKRLVEAYQRATHVNYSLELWSRRKRVRSACFRSFELLGVALNDELLHAMLEEIRDGETVYDLGANVGHYSLALGKTFPASKVYSFEPSPSNVSKLRKNVRINSLSNVEVCPVGLSDSQGRLAFYRAYPHGRSSFQRAVIEADDARVVGEIQVEVSDLDSIVETAVRHPPDHLKIDVEGHELAVLRGAQETIRENLPTIYLEPHPHASGDAHCRTLRELVVSMGYMITELGRPWVCRPTD